MNLNLVHALVLQNELDKIIKEIEPKLVKIATKKHNRLDEIRDVRFDENYVTFRAEGYCMGHFEDWFDVTWEELDKMS